MPEIKVKKKLPGLTYLVVTAMFFYTILQFGNLAKSTEISIVMLISSVIYFLVIFLFFGIANLAYKQHTYLLWGSAVLSFVIGYFLSGLTGVWSLLSSWSMILFGGTIVGRLTLSKYNPQKVYILGLITVMLFAVALFSPLWSDLIEAANQGSETMLENTRQNLLTLGYGADAVENNLNSARGSLKVLINLIPALTVISVAMQFSIGYIIFLLWLDKNNYQNKLLAPFIFWKVPFGIMLILIITILLRVFGNEMLIHIADNIIAIIAVFYAITGLALMEYYLRKFRLSRFMKIIFYIMLFLTQVIGFFVAVILGFIDSFIDWRKVQQLSLVKE